MYYAISDLLKMTENMRFQPYLHFFLMGVVCLNMCIIINENDNVCFGCHYTDPYSLHNMLYRRLRINLVYDQ